MKIERIKLEHCCVIKLSKIMSNCCDLANSIEKQLMRAVYGHIFVVNDENILLGTYSIDSYIANKNVDRIEKIPCIFDGDDTSLKQQVAQVLGRSIRYGILPIVDKNTNKLVGGVSFSHNEWDEQNLFDISYLSFLDNKKISLEYFFTANKYKKVAFWGVDKTSLTYANYLRNCAGVQVIGIYDFHKKKPYCTEDILNYEVEINYVHSFEDILTISNLDLIIVADWTMRSLGKLQCVEMSLPKIIYMHTLLTSYEFLKEMNNRLFLSWKKKMAGKGVELVSITIPTEDEIGCKVPKYNTMSLTEQLEWMVNDNGWSPTSPEAKEFLEARPLLSRSIKKASGLVYLSDFTSKYINYINKGRIVLNLPKEHDNTIYLLGPCIVTGSLHQDKYTLGYFLQEYFNENDLRYKVVALGIPDAAHRHYFFNILNDFEMKEGDKIFWFEQSKKAKKGDLDVQSLFVELYKKHGPDLYIDAPIHLGKAGMKEVAQYLFEYTQNHSDFKPQILEYEGVDDAIAVNEEYLSSKTTFEGNPQLEAYKKYIHNEAIHTPQIVGSIVMNCNPFTLGHQYLIEYAARQVSYLYIFVVEEDKSFFKFEDRIALVKAGTAHIKNVKVLSSGEFIISSNTFSEYFDKANLKGAVIDTSLDVETFAQQIAPALDITVRFVGEEPLDPITNQYNQSMKNLLPKYGIELREIPRKEFGNHVISASRVRACMETKDWDEIREIVPVTTFEFLYENFKG